MGKKIHPGFFRLENNFLSHWYPFDPNANLFIKEDERIREFLEKELFYLLSKVDIQRAKRSSGEFDLCVTAFVSHLNFLNKNGKDSSKDSKKNIDETSLKKQLEEIIDKNINKSFELKFKKIRNPELDVNIVAKQIAFNLIGRENVKTVAKKALLKAMKAGAKGCRIKISGRIGGVDIARSEKYHDGSIPLHTLKEDIDFASAIVRMSFGTLGVKVWINKEKDKKEGE